MGIVNGIDPELWDPQGEWERGARSARGAPGFACERRPRVCVRNGPLTAARGLARPLSPPPEDPWLPMPYDSSTCEAGKAAARAELRRRLQLSPQDDRLIVAVVSRLTAQKGVDLIKHAAWRTRDRGGQFVLLGSAPDPKVQVRKWGGPKPGRRQRCGGAAGATTAVRRQSLLPFAPSPPPPAQGDFNALAGQLSGGHDNNAAFAFTFDEPLSHLIYAAADIVLVPSIFEPCGLTQMIAMRYGGSECTAPGGGVHMRVCIRPGCSCDV